MRQRGEPVAKAAAGELSHMRQTEVGGDLVSLPLPLVGHGPYLQGGDGSLCEAACEGQRLEPWGQRC